MGAVGPVAEVGVHRTAELGLVRSVAAPRHHRLHQPPQDEVPERVLAVLLSDVGEVAAAVDDTAAAAARGWTTGPVLGVGEQRTPLRLQQVDDPQVLPELFQLRTGGGEEVDVGVAGPPAAGSHVGGAAEGEVALAGFDSHGLAQWCVLEPAPRRPPRLRVVASPGRCRRCRRRSVGRGGRRRRRRSASCRGSG